MKKHPVDDLFNRKLKDLERRPSENAWLRIEAERKSERRASGWVWYAAASTVIGLLGGYIVWQNSQHTIGKLANPENVIARTETKAQLPEVTNSEPVTEQAWKVKPEMHKPDQSIAVVKAKSAGETIPVVQERRELASVELIQQPREEVTQEMELKSGNLPSVSELELPTIENKSAGEIAKLDSEPARTIVVAVESNLEETADKQKTSRFSKVFRQLKNARAGEKVDWEEVGFNPKALVARVDDRLRIKDEKTSDKYQNSKDRTKL